MGTVVNATAQLLPGASLSQTERQRIDKNEIRNGRVQIVEFSFRQPRWLAVHHHVYLLPLGDGQVDGRPLLPHRANQIADKQK